MPLDCAEYSLPDLDLPPWHAKNPSGIMAALGRADEVAPHLSSLANFILPRLPRALLCSSTIKNATDGRGPSAYTRPIERAIKHQWFSPNSEAWTNTETADCDYPDWDEKLDELKAIGLPEPTFIVVSPWSWTAHLVWTYDRPVNNFDPRQVRLHRGIKRGLVVAFGADPRFANRLQKNPWHVRRGILTPGEGRPGIPCLWDGYVASGSRLTYHTILRAVPRPVALLDLFRPLAAYATERGITLLQRADGSTRPVYFRPAPDTQTPGPHGSRLFHAARKRIYRACTANAQTIRTIIERTAVEIRSPADAADIDAMTASISRFMRERWNGPLDGRPGTLRDRDIAHGVMSSGARADGRIAAWHAMDLSEKRAEAGRRSAALSKECKDAAIRRAIADVADTGAAITQAAVADRAGVSIATVKRRRVLRRRQATDCGQRPWEGLGMSRATWFRRRKE